MSRENGCNICAGATGAAQPPARAAATPANGAAATAAAPPATWCAASPSRAEHGVDLIFSLGVVLQLQGKTAQ